MAPHVRTVNTASGATAVQIVYGSRRGSRDIKYIASAHDDAELAALKAAARQRIAAAAARVRLRSGRRGIWWPAGDYVVADG